jgi:hypothetical protein
MEHSSADEQVNDRRKSLAKLGMGRREYPRAL